MSLLASLVFVLSAVAAVAALRLTIAQYSDAALANIAALRSADTAREFRFQTVTVIARPAVGGEVLRIAARNPAPRWIKKPLAGLRAAA